MDALLTGWGRTPATRATIERPDSSEGVRSALDRVAAARGRGLTARGLGRSYGDAAQNAGGTVLDMTALDRVLETDVDRGVVRVEAGISLDTLMRRTLPLGWFVPVTPGTRYVTAGGALAADIHGKNHHADGSFADHVLAVVLETPTGTRAVAPPSDPEVFWATAGGMGLTGIVTEVTLRLIPVETSWMRVDTDRCRDLDDVMTRMVDGDHLYRYSVAWIDCLSAGRRLGRAVLTRAHHADADDLGRHERSAPLRFEPRVRIDAPQVFPSGLVNSVTARAFNELWYRRAPRQRRDELQPLSTFFHPLDGIGCWNRMYGPRGFLQYQFAVPDAAGEVVRTAIERLAAAGIGSVFGVLKRFGRGNPGPLSFPLAGWTLALDLPVGDPNLAALLDDLDDAVVAVRGRIYLAKDSRVSPGRLREMYPRIDEWSAACRRVDPDGVLTSDLARRLGLAGTQADRPVHAESRVSAGPRA